MPLLLREVKSYRFKGISSEHDISSNHYQALYRRLCNNVQTNLAFCY